MEKNMQLLVDLYNIAAESNHEQEITKAVKKLFVERGCKVKNKDNNLYITKGKADTYPCIAAHLDEVHSDRGEYEAIYSPQNDIIYGWSYTHNDFCGIGADDKNGIWVALQMVERLDYCKVALFRGEEIGCVGSRVAWMNFFKDCRFVLQVDRRNAGDLITSISGRMVSDDFMEAITPIANRFGYKETHGLMTDVETLCENGVGISCVNMSCGYYNPHSDVEFTKWSELLNTADFVEQICIGMTDVYTYTYEPPFVPTYRSTSIGRGIYDWWDNGSYVQTPKTADEKSDEADMMDIITEDLYEKMMYDAYFYDVTAEEIWERDYKQVISLNAFLIAYDNACDLLYDDMNGGYYDAWEKK